MFVQSSHFIEAEGGDTRKRVLFYGQEKNPTTIALAKMNLAVHGLEGQIAEAITYYQDEHSLAAIVWLYRGQRRRFVSLVGDYLQRVAAEGSLIPAALAEFGAALTQARQAPAALADWAQGRSDLDPARRLALAEALTELDEATAPYQADAAQLLIGLQAWPGSAAVAPAPSDSPLLAGEGLGVRESLAATQMLADSETNAAQHQARHAFEPLAEAIRGLVKQVDLLYKLAARAAEAGEGGEVDVPYDRRAAARQVEQLDGLRKAAVDQLRQAIYFHRQVVWLQDRFPDAELRAVLGLVRLVDRAEIAAADWSLTPGRYVGVARAEVDEDFDFEQTLRDIHTELADLNREAVDLAARIQENFEELGA
jgi:type I restriction enzyme M protein